MDRGVVCAHQHASLTHIVTVAILAQGTSWAVAVTQAFLQAWIRLAVASSAGLIAPPARCRTPGAHLASRSNPCHRRPRDIGVPECRTAHPIEAILPHCRLTRVVSIAFSGAFAHHRCLGVLHRVCFHNSRCSGACLLTCAQLLDAHRSR